MTEKFNFIAYVVLILCGISIFFLIPGDSIIRRQNCLTLFLLLAFSAYFFIELSFSTKEKAYKRVRFGFSRLNTTRDACILGASIGGLFFLLVLGIRVLSPAYIDWLFNNDDSTQHFLGWHFFKGETWTLPPGKIASWGYPVGTSIVYTDTIPLLAFFFKLWRFILPQPFQYVGIWILLCYVLQGVAAALIVRKITVNSWQATAMTLLLVTSPAMLLRARGHEALVGHWLILFAFYAVITDKENNRFRWSWLILASSAALIHFYLLCMVIVIWVASLLQRWIVWQNQSGKSLIMEMLVVITATLASMWTAGYFIVSEGDLQRKGFGYYSANLNTFINPMGWSLFLRNGSIAKDGQYEGFAYLGLGGIVLCICTGIVLLQRPYLLARLKQYRMLLVLVMACGVYAISNNVTLGQYVLLKYDLPSIVESKAEILRSSGRFAWIVFYGIYIFCFWSIVRANLFSKRTLGILLFSLALLQCIDLSHKFRGLRDFYTKKHHWESKLKSDFWKVAAKQHLIYIPNQPIEWQSFGYYAASHQLTLSNGYFARVDKKAFEQASEMNLNAFLTGNFAEDSLFIVTDNTILGQAPDRLRIERCIRNIDGFTVAFVCQDDSLRERLSGKEMVEADR